MRWHRWSAIRGGFESFHRRATNCEVVPWHAGVLRHEISEVLCPHSALFERRHILGSEGFAHDAVQSLRKRRIVVSNWRSFGYLHLRQHIFRQAMRTPNIDRNTLDRCQQLFAHALVVCAHRQLQVCAVRNDVMLGACMECADGYHTRR